MKFELFINRIFRLPLDKALKEFDNYFKNVGFKEFSEQQRALDILAHKTNTQNMFDKEYFQEAALHIHLAADKNIFLCDVAYEELKKYPMVIWIEVIGTLTDEEIMNFLENWANDLPATLIETLIINVNDNLQYKLVNKYKSKIDINSNTYDNFYYSVSHSARKLLDNLFPTVKNNNILLEFKDIEENKIVEFVKDNLESLKNKDINKIFEILLVKTSRRIYILETLELLKDKLVDLTNENFELIMSRYIYLRNRYDIYNVDKDDGDITLFNLFVDRFKKLGLQRTLSLFKLEAYYGSDKNIEYIIYEFIDEAYEDEKLKKYINDDIITNLIVKFVEDCSKNVYSIEQFRDKVDKIDIDKNKLFNDDFIEAMIACGQLMKNRLITDKDEYFLKLREMFVNKTLNNCKRDGTYLEDISLNRIFYRLVKGGLPFDKFYATKTYKGLIYLSKSGLLIDNADFVTKYLSDLQVARLNILPLLRWKKNRLDEKVSKESVSFFERMGLQLLCFFGELKAKYLLESGMMGNRMESLFDGLDYESIEIDDSGKSLVNTDLLEFLFGRGNIKESNSVINKMICGEIPDFEKYFTDFCNDYEDVLTSLNGILSVKRIVKKFESVNLPVELKPNQLHYKKALKEMNTCNVDVLNRAIEWLDEATKREFSTIPKVSGRLGDFTYEVLDLKNPLIVAVGYMSHCCFKVDGISKDALKHSMKSINGRTFVVYNKGKFLTQSWIWRNGDVICFDSVESGSVRHEMYSDNFGLVDVYKKAAREMMDISKECEDDIQRVKVVTVGKSDFTFAGLTKVEGQVPRPLEKNVYVYDSIEQGILCGTMPENIRYGEVGVQYEDPRSDVIFIKDIDKTSIDTLDDVVDKIFSIRYSARGDMTIPEIKDYKKIVVGDDWFITVDRFGTVAYDALLNKRGVYNEFKKYASIFNISLDKKASEVEFDGENRSLVKHPGKKGVL